MKCCSLLLITTASLISIPVFAAVPSDLVLSAKAVKAIYDKGLPLPQIVDVTFAQQNSSPPKLCVMVIYDRKPNTTCPDDSIIGSTEDKGYAVCLNATTNEVDSVMPVQTPDCMLSD